MSFTCNTLCNIELERFNLKVFLDMFKRVLSEKNRYK
jgi:hypothetical protein